MTGNLHQPDDWSEQAWMRSDYRPPEQAERRAKAKARLIENQERRRAKRERKDQAEHVRGGEAA